VPQQGAEVESGPDREAPPNLALRLTVRFAAWQVNAKTLAGLEVSRGWTTGSNRFRRTAVTWIGLVSVEKRAGLIVPGIDRFATAC
jgi:hypothetical protein